MFNRFRVVVILLGLVVGLLPVAGVGASNAQQGQVPAGWRRVTWQGVIISFDPRVYAFSQPPSNEALVRAAALTETPDPCKVETPPADCYPAYASFRLYPGNGLDVRTWAVRNRARLAPDIAPNFTDTVIGDRQAVLFHEVDGIGDETVYVLPVGSNILVLRGVFDPRIARLLQWTQPLRAQLAVGRVAITSPARAQVLWTQATGGGRVTERPVLPGGSFVTILAFRPGATQVRTSDGVTGWIRGAPAQALMARATLTGEQARFTPFSSARVTHPNGIPLRTEPRSAAPTKNAQLKPGQQMTVLGVRGDWLRVLTDESQLGWVRWYYDGAQYISAAR